jgi:hypothetical protein
MYKILKRSMFRVDTPPIISPLFFLDDGWSVHSKRWTFQYFIHSLSPKTQTTTKNILYMQITRVLDLH